jgi:hypothetical protein
LIRNNTDLSQNIPIADIRQIIFASDNELNLCSLSANWPYKPPMYYKWGTLLNLTNHETSAILAS